jgi:hypothetical protein
MFSRVFPTTDEMDHWRCYFYPITERKGLPIYDHYLDELTVPTKDIKEFIKIVKIIKNRNTTGLPMSWRTFERITSFLPNTEFVSWEVFNDLFVVDKVWT